MKIRNVVKDDVVIPRNKTLSTSRAYSYDANIVGFEAETSELDSLEESDLDFFFFLSTFIDAFSLTSIFDTASVCKRWIH